MSSRIVEFIEDAISRRAFVQRVSAATAAFISGVLFAPESGHANPVYAIQCCSLCRLPITCSYHDCTCEWSWTCCHPPSGCVPNNRMWKCHECIETPMAPCSNDPVPCNLLQACGKKAQCPGVKCSKVTVVQGKTCPGTPC